MSRITAQEAEGANVCAFLDMIAVAEIGDKLLELSDDGYNVCVGSTVHKPILFDGYQAHPRLRNLKLNSDAAGRYQLMGRYYEPYRVLLGLPDFSPISQDKIAIQQIRECRAFGWVQRGHVEEGIDKVKHIWASLPGAGYGQPERPLSFLISAYTAAGGLVV